jgi:oxygen-dependent protoporphyrinogen oxidase
MNTSPKTSFRVAVIGGGISGLAAAHRLVELWPECDVELLESRSRLGGAIWTVHEEGYQIEQGVDNFITTLPWGLDLCRRLGLSDQLVTTNPDYRQTFVVRRGRLYKLPDGFLMMAPTRMWPMAVTPILSPLGKLRCALEYFLPPRKDDADESMAAFVRRRLGREAYQRLVEPLVSAVYAADLEKLSVEATLPRFRAMEREHGGLIRAMRRQIAEHRRQSTEPQAGGESGARFGMFVTLRGGLSSIPEAIVARLPDGAVRLASPVERIERDGGRWKLAVGKARDSAESLVVESRAFDPTFDAVVVATPSYAAAELLRPHDAELADRLASIAHSGTAILSLAFDREQIRHPLDGMGIVVPAAERSPILACSLSSRKYPHRAPEGKVLLRVFVGGSRFPEMAEMDEAELRPRVLGELAALLGIKGEPIYSNLARWPRTMPQYHVGHKELVAAIESRVERLPGIELCGNAYHGVGIPDCVHGAEQAAERVVRASNPGGTRGEGTCRPRGSSSP